MSAPSDVTVINTFDAALNWGVAFTSKVPRVWGGARIPAVLITDSSEGVEELLRRVGKVTTDAQLPESFVLCKLVSIGDPAEKLINKAAGKRGVFVSSDSGQTTNLQLVDFELTLSCTMYSTKLTTAAHYALQLRQRSKASGQMSLDALSLPVRANASTESIAITNPVGQNESSLFTDRMFAVSYDLRVNSAASTLVRTVPISSLVLVTSSDGTTESVSTILNNQDDWTL